MEIEHYSIPQEFHEFLRRQYGQTVLVAGPSGSGKTVFALSLLKELLNEHYESKNYVYVTSRVPSYTMRIQFEWMDQVIQPDLVLDLSSPSSIADPQDPTTVISDELTFLSVIDEKIRQTRFPFCVIDTIEALAEVLNADVKSLVSSLSKLSKDTFAKVVIISEHETGSHISSAVDGVLILQAYEEENGGIWRDITLKKLRGTRIETRTRGFTISDDGFSQLWNADGDDLRKFSITEPTSHSGTRYYLGLQPFDEIFKGFRLGSTSFWEIGADVDNEVIITLLLTTISNFTNQGGGVVIIPPNKLTFRRIKSAALKYEFFDRLNTNVRMVSLRFSDEADHDPIIAREPYVIFTRGRAEDMRLSFDTALKELRANGCGEILLIIGFGFLQSMLDYGDLSRWAMNITEISAQESGLCIAIGYNSTPKVNEMLADLADMHIGFSTRASATLVRGIRPRTSQYCMYTMKKDGGVRIEFQEIN